MYNHDTPTAMFAIAVSAPLTVSLRARITWRCPASSAVRRLAGSVVAGRSDTGGRIPAFGGATVVD